MALRLASWALEPCIQLVFLDKLTIPNPVRNKHTRTKPQSHEEIVFVFFVSSWALCEVFLALAFAFIRKQSAPICEEMHGKVKRNTSRTLFSNQMDYNCGFCRAIAPKRFCTMWIFLVVGKVDSVFLRHCVGFINSHPPTIQKYSPSFLNPTFRYIEEKKII